jgi:DNA recombination protein RmuC
LFLFRTLSTESRYDAGMNGNVVLFTVADHGVTLAELAGGAAAAIVLLFLVVVLAWRATAKRAAERNEEAQAQLAELMRTQTELTGRMKAMGDALGARQGDLARAVNERLDGLGHRIGQNLTEASKSTHENLSRLAERLAVIDTAQKNITALSTQVVALQQVLANKQTRGAFGQARMEAIVQDGLPPSSYAFQATLSNNTRPDCVVRLPNGAPSLVIDAKFPLEAWNAIRAGGSPEAVRTAEIQFRRDTQKHIKDIAERYFITGETQDTAFMFVPSESIFADIHEHFEDVVQTAHRARVIIVSPSLLMLSIQVVQSVLRDQRMREQAHVIQQEVTKLMDDVRRVSDRVRNLQSHFGQANKDVEQILISTDKVARRGAKIEGLDLKEIEEAAHGHEPDLELPLRRAGE